jgi:tripartite ATP-independent transporter DctP family solute receptor
MKNKIFLGMFFLLIGAVLFLNINSSNQLNKNIKKEEKTLKLKMAHNLPVNSAMHEASLLFAKKVKEKSNGRVLIDIYPNQQLGNDYKMVELAREGSIDILLTPTAKMSVSLPSVQYADLPFLFPSREDAYELLDGEPGRMILKQLDGIDLLGVTFWENGFKHFTANAPLLTPDDFKGKKIRIMKSRIIMEQFKALGAKPVPIDFHATKKALEDRVVEGQENPLVAIVNMDFHKVQSNLTLSEHAYLPYIFSLSKKTLLNLPLEVQTLLIETGKKGYPLGEKRNPKKGKTFFRRT